MQQLSGPLPVNLLPVVRGAVAAAREELAAASLVDERFGARKRAREWLSSWADMNAEWLQGTERKAMLDAAIDDLFGLGPIDWLVNEPGVSEVMVNGPREVLSERDGTIVRESVMFEDDDHVLSIIDRIAERDGARFDDASPILSCRLRLPGSPADGARVQAVAMPIAVDHHILNIRKFDRTIVDPKALLDNGTIDQRMLEFLEAIVVGRQNVVVAGGTGVGKTTLLGAMSTFIPHEQRVCLLEDVPEITITGHHTRKQCRDANIEGRGQITMDALLKSTLRERPDRIVVGECRGEEAFEMLQAMNTGHEGTFTTVHASSPRDTVVRIRSMVQLAGISLSATDIVDMVCRAVDFIVFLRRYPDGTRRVSEISEVSGAHQGVPTLTPIMGFEQDPWSGGAVTGRFRATGNDISPEHAERMRFQGVGIDGWWFRRED